MTAGVRRFALTCAAVAGAAVAGAGTGPSFFFAAERRRPAPVDEEFVERLRSLRTPRIGRGAADDGGELHPLLLWPMRLVVVVFLVALAAAAAYALVRAFHGLRALHRLLALRASADSRAEDYVDEDRSGSDAVTALRRRMRHGLDVGVEQLDASAPAREVVIACFQGLERAAAEAGAAPAAADTPTELVSRLLSAHRVPVESARTLVALYEQARFSPHAVDDAMRADARRCLDDVRSRLAPA